MKYYQNYHKHTSYSNVYIKDSPLVPNDYFEYYKSLDCPQIYSTLEHGWQSPYFRIYDDLEKFNKKYNTNIKFIFGVEVYWVKDRLTKDKANCHMVILARNDNGRKAINKMLSEANKTGYYYRPRVDLQLLLSLPKDDVFVTTACVAYWNKYEDIEELTVTLNKHFNHFYLEVQAHDTEVQRNLHKKLLKLHNKYNIPFIFGTDSHVITEAQMKDRDDLLQSGNIFYEDEQGWYMDCPSYKEAFYRMQVQGILSDEQIEEALQNTNKILEFEDIVLDRSLKVPVITKYKDKSQQERDELFKQILRKEWKRQLSDINKEKFWDYIEEIRQDIDEIVSCGMSDYFILSYETMKLGQQKYGGILTPTGRGSAVSMYINKLLGLTKVDRINSPVLMYPERFLTKERVLESHTPPDIDNNVSEREPFILAQKELLGETSTYDLIALGTLHYKSAFKMYARAYNLDPQIANEVTRQIDKYELARKHAEEDEKDNINIFDYVDKDKYGELIKGCQKYRGIIDNRKGHPCATIAYNGDVEEDIGIILCKSETTKKEVLTAVIESGTIDSFGFLKQDYLIVDSIGLTYDIYKEIGIKPYTVNELLEKIDGDQNVWDIYKNGYTMCVNQVEQYKTTQKAMKYQPKNIYELSQFVAGVRPSFQSMYKTFENREHFDYGIKALDCQLQDEYCDSSFIIYQENLMKVLGFAGFPMKDTYTIIKAISKKKDYIIKDAKPQFIKNFAQAIIDTGDAKDEESAHDLATKVWKIIEDSSSYGFNCVSGDTKMYRPSTNGKYNPTIEEMYLIKNDRAYAKKTHHINLHDKYNKYGYGYGLSMDDDGVVKKNKIIDIYQQSKSLTYTITTSSGKTIKCTSNHKFPTKNGIKECRDLHIGDELYCAGKHQHTYFDSSLTNGDFTPNIPNKGEQGFQKNNNGMSVLYDNFRKLHSENSCACENCGIKYYETKRFEVHHKDLNRKNNKTDNFQWLCASCHKKIHYQNGRTKQYENGLPTYYEKIISIIQNKEEIVYDVSMSEEVNHNFVIDNGIVTCNCSHAFCMAVDSATIAYLKAYYPLEFYKVVLQRYTNKGEKDKVSLIKQEMVERGFVLKDIKFRDDNREFKIDKNNNCITQTMSSVKNISKITPKVLYAMRKAQFKDVVELFVYLSEETKLKKTDIEILIKLDYFEEFGNINYLDCVYQKFIDRYKKTYVDKTKEARIQEIRDYAQTLNVETTIFDKIHYQIQLLGYTNLTTSCDDDIYAVQAIELNQWGTPFVTLYQVNSGVTAQYKADKRYYNDHPIEVGDIIDAAIREKDKKRKSDNGWETIGSEEVLVAWSKEI